MGYTTNFSGTLKFARTMTGPELAVIKQYFGKDCRDNPDWGTKDLYYMDFGFSPAFDGIQHDGSEKTYDFDKLVNTLIKLVKKDIKDFELVGELKASGERYDDRWILRMVKNKATVVPQTLKGRKVTCPHCESAFLLEEET